MKTPDLPLRDIHLPDPVSWWPLAPGWWLCFALAVAGLAAAAWWWRGAPSRRARRAALAELAGIEQHYSASADGHACAQGLSRLLRRLALLAGDSHAAHSHGEQLQRVLAPVSKTALPPEVLDVLRAAPYSPAAAAAIDAASYRAALVALRAWLSGLRVPRRAVLGLRHAAV